MTQRYLFRRLRGWFPTPTTKGRFHVKRWVLLEANRLAVTGALLTSVFVSFVLLATAWTFEMQTPSADTSAVENILDTLLSGMILLVAIVVSINSIVLSRDMSSLVSQEDGYSHSDFANRVPATHRGLSSATV